MRASVTRLLFLSLLAAGLVALTAASTASAQYPLQRGESGPEVREWQSELNYWFRNVTPRHLGRVVVDGTFGADTEAATAEFQRGQGLPDTGEVDLRTRRTLTAVNGRLIGTPYPQRALEWPLVVPEWFWPWARWYLGRSEFEDRQRDDAVRPDAAPLPIPTWAWRRLNVLVGDQPETRARVFALDRMHELFSNRGLFEPRGLEATTVQRSERDPYWALVTGSREGPEQGNWAIWLRLRENRWTGWQISELAQDEPNLDPDSVPCDIRPAFAEPEC